MGEPLIWYQRRDFLENAKKLSLHLEHFTVRHDFVEVAEKLVDEVDAHAELVAKLEEELKELKEERDELQAQVDAIEEPEGADADADDADK
jgi:cell division protein FtsB